MLITTLNTGVRYTGVCFLIMGVFSGLNIQVSWETQIVSSPRHKVSQTDHIPWQSVSLTNRKPL
jgi:hypothetical protein